MTKEAVSAFMKTSSGKRAIKLLADCGLDLRSVFAMVLAQVNEVLPLLDEGRNYKIGEMFGNETRWTGMTWGSHSAAGMCLAYMVKTKMVGLELHKTRSGKGPKKYRRVAIDRIMRSSLGRIAVAAIPTTSINLGA